jgi:hypothetical protein
MVALLILFVVGLTLFNVVTRPSVTSASVTAAAVTTATLALMWIVVAYTPVSTRP